MKRVALILAVGPLTYGVIHYALKRRWFMSAICATALLELTFITPFLAGYIGRHTHG